MGSSPPRNRTRVSCIAGRFFTNPATRSFHNQEISMVTKTEGKKRLLWSFSGVDMFYVRLAMSHSHLSPQISLHVRKVTPTPRQQEVRPRMQPFAGFLFSQESHHQGEDSHPGRQAAYLRLNHRKEEQCLQANQEAEGWTRWPLEMLGHLASDIRRCFPSHHDWIGFLPPQNFTTIQHGLHGFHL